MLSPFETPPLRDPQFEEMLDLFAMLKKGHCDGIKVRIGRLQNLLSSSCMGMCSVYARWRDGVFYHRSALFVISRVVEHLDFMNNVGANQFEFKSFKQLEYDYSGYQSLTDVPKASVYTEDVIDIQVNRKLVFFLFN